MSNMKPSQSRKLIFDECLLMAYSVEKLQIIEVPISR